MLKKMAESAFSLSESDCQSICIIIKIECLASELETLLNNAKKKLRKIWKNEIKLYIITRMIMLSIISMIIKLSEVIQIINKGCHEIFQN